MNTQLANKQPLAREKNPPEGAWRLLIFMFIVLIIFAVSYFGLKFGYTAYLQAQITKIDTEISNLSAEIPQDDQNEFLQFQYQLLNLRSILNNHVIGTRILPLIEANTNQAVFYRTFSVNIEESQVRLAGTAQSFDRLAEQLEAYNQMPGVLNYQISNSTLNDANKVDFETTLYLDPELFRS